MKLLDTCTMSGTYTRDGNKCMWMIYFDDFAGGYVALTYNDESSECNNSLACHKERHFPTRNEAINYLQGILPAA